MARLNVKIRSKVEESKTEQIVEQLSEQIRTGKLKPGERLPSQRTLSTRLGVSRTLVYDAYKQLEGKRLIVTSANLGSRVKGKSQKPSKATAQRARK